MKNFRETVFGLIKLSKPLQWSKSFGNMLIGFALATKFGFFEPMLFFLGFLAVGPFLWGGLYALNDWTDREKDKLHPVKKSRPIPSGEVSEKLALLFSIILIALSFAIGIFLNNYLFLLCLFAMLLNQLLYTIKPFEFKKKPVIDLISGSLVNPFFRFYAGWVLIATAFNAPLEIIVFIALLQFGGFSLYRLASAAHEKEMKYKSSVVVFGEKTVKTVSYAAIAFGMVSFFAAILNGILEAKFLWLAVLSMVALPVYWKAFTSPQKMDMKKNYKNIYLHYTLFAIGFFVIGYLV